EMVLLRVLAFRPVSAEPDRHSAGAAPPERPEKRVVAASDSPERPAPPARSEAVEPKPATEAVSEDGAGYAGGPSDWLEIIKATGIGGMVRELAHNCVLHSVDEKGCVLLLDPGQQQVRSPRLEERLQSALQAYYKRPMKLVIKVEKAVGETPAVSLERQRQERQKAAEQDIERDETVLAMKEAFDARVVPGSIEPLDE
ncbi:MAG: DNA polymerase III subunit gamma/tau C-terminal domain-containing protein, partial [Pseudomonadota bacterium]